MRIVLITALLLSLCACHDDLADTFTDNHSFIVGRF